MEETNPVDSMLKQFVAHRDVPCPGCGYNVRDLPTDRCPECGDPLELKLALAEPKQAAAIAGLIGLSSGFGLGGLLLIYMVIVSLMRHPIGGREEWNFLLVNGLGFIVHGACIAIWLRLWKRIRRASLARRIVYVCICWLLPMVYVVVFAATIR